MTMRILTVCFATLLIFTPLFFTPLNHELFEYNKMILVYSLSIVIATTWLLRMLRSKQLLIKSTPLDIPIGLFVLSQLLSTVFSIDPHTSWWGYYSRSNGGMFSILSYVFLYYALVSNFTKPQIIRLIKWLLYGGLLVSLWAIPEHFGYSPSCKILVDRWEATCWVQDVQSRVFATLGQPNWLAAYLGMLIFPALYFFLTCKSVVQKFFYFFLTLAYYTAFTFTYSRGGMLGFLGGLVVFLLFTVIKISDLKPIANLLTFNLLLKETAKDPKSSIDLSIKVFPLQLLGIAVMGFLIINLLFGSSLTGDFRLIKQAAPPPRPSITSSSTGTQLENGGTESGQIRLIVWQGALDIFKAYPILGSGVETFAYSYYQFRPIAHNYVSEWDFLYNKAHNEYLNYLATTGAIGFMAYLLMILSFILFSIKQIFSLDYKNPEHYGMHIFLSAMLASYISYLIQNLFGFSVVIIALLFFLFPGFSVVAVGKPKAVEVKNSAWFVFIPASILKIIYKRQLYVQVVSVIITLTGVYMLISVFNIWRADVNFKVGSDFSDAGNPGRAYNALLKAVILNRQEPLYQSELANAASSAALALSEDNSTRSAELKDESVLFTKSALSISPANVSLWRTALRTYFELSLLDPSFEEETLKTIDHAITLAPTDPKLYYNKGLILSQLSKNKPAIEAMQKALELKNNYREARLTLADFYIADGQIDSAKNELEIVLKQIPNDPDALKKLEEATATAKQTTGF